MSHPTPREDFEAAHRRWLGPWATPEADAGGRKYPEGPHPYRTCFQRDRDRIVHCAAFRRLDFKTQVFVPHEHDHFRTRLTHTLEVAQIGRTCGRALRLNEDLVEAVALAHDLGHPPFGHAGEKVLDELTAGHGGFEHNRQSLRVVDYLEHPYPQFRGLNLTSAVRECLSRHQTRYDAPACWEFDPALAGPLEGQLVDLADEIAYTAADLEDALAAEWITIQQLEGLALWHQAWAAAQAKMPDARAIHKQIRACKGVLAAMADDVIAQSRSNIQALGLDRPGAAVAARRRSVGFSPATSAAVQAMQDFLLHNVYAHPVAAGHVQEARKIIQDLFATYQAGPAHLPGRYLQRVQSGQDDLPRVICDYIAGMTDRFCRQEHDRLCR